MDTDENSIETSGRFFSMFEKHGYYKDDAVYLNAGAPGTEMLRMLPPIIEAATSYQMVIYVFIVCVFEMWMWQSLSC